MTDQTAIIHAKFGTLGGILTILLFNITSEDIIKTMFLACVGAIVSFFVSLFLRYCLGKLKK